MDIKDCIFRKNVREFPYRLSDGREGKKIIACCDLLTGELCFNISVDNDQCKRCLQGRTESPRNITDTEYLFLRAKVSLFNRIKCHNDKRFQKIFIDASMSNSVEILCRLGVDKNEIRGAVLESVGAGYPKEEADKIFEHNNIEQFTNCEYEVGRFVQNEVYVQCGFVNEKLGWKHSFPSELCLRCSRGENSNVIEKINKSAAMIRLRLGEKETPAWAGNISLTKVISILLSCKVPKKEVGWNLLSLVRKGKLLESRATELAGEFDITEV